MSLIPRLLLKNKTSLSREQSLKAIPIRNEKILAELDEDTGEMLLLIPRRDDRWVRLLARVFYVPPHKKVSLDELGTTVWNLCDGKNSVREIVGQFAEKYKLSRKEAEVSLTEFLRQMARKRLIGLVISEPTPPDRGDRRRRTSARPVQS